jgi:hypothetical protein
MPYPLVLRRACGDRLHASYAQALLRLGVNKGARNQRLADPGIDAGDEA